MKRTIKTLITLNIILLFANCVKEISFPSPSVTLDQIVISGRFTNLDEPHILRLTRPGNYQKQQYEPVKGAKIMLSDDTGQQWTYQEIDELDTLHYYILNNVVGVSGRAYSLEIQLPNGDRFRTQPQVMPKTIPIADAALKGEKIKITRSIGDIIEEPRITLRASTIVPADGSGGYVRWDAFSTHLFFEITKIYEIFDKTQRLCWVTFYFNSQNVALYNLNDLQPGTSLDLKIAERRIDEYIELRSCYSAYQLTTTKEAFQYWERVQNQLNQNGTIFDTPPAPITGNVWKDGDPLQPTLGFFEVCGADIKRVYGLNGELGQDYRHFPDYCQYDWSGSWPPVNHYECHDCRTLKNSTEQKPWFWQ